MASSRAPSSEASVPEAQTSETSLPEVPVSLPAGRTYARPAADRLWSLLPLWGTLVAAALLLARRPDAVTHAQFWAEDGRMFFANVYNHGVLATLMVPQAGYFVELPVLAAGLARLVPLAHAPLVLNLVGILTRALPVGLLLSRRAETISPDLRVRALLAALYTALPGAAETHANAVNAMWYLALAAVIVLMLRPAASWAGRLFDIAILVLCGVTGPFVIALAPIAFVWRRWRGPLAVSDAKLAVLTAGALLQLLALSVLQHHLPAGFNATPRPSGPLHGSVPLLLQVLGTRVVAESIVGNSTPVGLTTAGFLGVFALAGAWTAIRRGSAELRLMIAFGAAIFAMSLIRPIGTDWPGLLVAGADSRYFVIPQFAAVAALVWACGYNRHKSWSMLYVVVLLYMCAITIPSEWEYPPFGHTDFAQRAAQFEHAPPGTVMTFQLEPVGWLMTLKRR
jgi:hypothetical protein